MLFLLILLIIQAIIFPEDRKYFHFYLQQFYLLEYFDEALHTALQPVSLRVTRYRAHEPRSLLFPIKAGDVPCCPRKSFSSSPQGVLKANGRQEISQGFGGNS